MRFLILFGILLFLTMLPFKIACCVAGALLLLLLTNRPKPRIIYVKPSKQPGFAQTVEFTRPRVPPTPPKSPGARETTPKPGNKPLALSQVQQDIVSALQNMGMPKKEAITLAGTLPPDIKFQEGFNKVFVKSSLTSK